MADQKQIDPFSLTLRYWRYLVPAWLAFLLTMAAIVFQDITGIDILNTPEASVAAGLLWVASLAGAVLLQSRALLPRYAILGAGIPILAVWIVFVLTRGIILSLLGRPT